MYYVVHAFLRYIRKRPQCVLVCESAKVIWSPRKIVPNEEDNYTNPLLEIYPKKISTIKNIKNKRFKTRSEFLLCRVLDFFLLHYNLSDFKKRSENYTYHFFFLLLSGIYLSLFIYKSVCIYQPTTYD